MKIEYGNMFSELGKADILLVTTNSTVNKHDNLVMGKGAAKEIHQYNPYMRQYLGDHILRINKHLGVYGVILPMYTDPATRKQYYIKVAGTTLGAFQTKLHWRNPAYLWVIEKSTEVLTTYAALGSRIVCNYPGIGNGGLTEDEVLPIISTLPDNVLFYKYKE